MGEWELSAHFDDSYHGDRKPCECCGNQVEYRNGTALHETCIECTQAGCTANEPHCDRGAQMTIEEW
jgi:hypothetical protein